MPIANMHEVKRHLNTTLLPDLLQAGWEGEGIDRLYKENAGLEIWTSMFGWPKGKGPGGSLSIDVGVAPPLPGLNRVETLKSLCNGWDSKGLVYHVPDCWHRRFPKNPIRYIGQTPTRLAKRIGIVLLSIEDWSLTCCVEDLLGPAEEMQRSEYPHTRKRGRTWQRIAEKILGG